MPTTNKPWHLNLWSHFRSFIHPTVPLSNADAHKYKFAKDGSVRRRDNYSRSEARRWRVEQRRINIRNARHSLYDGTLKQRRYEAAHL